VKPAKPARIMRVRVRNKEGGMEYKSDAIDAIREVEWSLWLVRKMMG
jgi:hypothetical protein